MNFIQEPRYSHLRDYATRKSDWERRQNKAREESLSLTEHSIAITTGFLEMSSLLGLFERDNKIVVNVVFLVLGSFFSFKINIFRR